jgi:hypothetical protein
LVDWSKKDRIRLNEGTGYNGDWREDILCDAGTYIYSAQVQDDFIYIPERPSDNTGLGNIKILCSDLKNKNLNTKSYDI